MTTCTHPADKASTETLLTTCPDCGAECSGAHVGDDGLCYDERCPLHAMEGEIPIYTAVEIRRHIDWCRAAGLVPTEDGMVATECEKQSGAACEATERAVRAAWSAHFSREA